MSKNLNLMLSERLKKAKILKDLFSSVNGDELFIAFNKLNHNIDVTKINLESEFNRYFVGPDTPISAPYASIYLDKTDAVMTESTQKVRELYEVMGFKNVLKDTQPDDFLGLELDAYYQLLFVEYEKGIEYLKEIRCYFLFEHIQKWIFYFVNVVLSNEKEPSVAINYIVLELKQFIENEIKYEGELV